VVLIGSSGVRAIDGVLAIVAGVKAPEHHERFGAGKSEITEDQYREFTRRRARLGSALAWSHNRVEGRQEYVQLLYIPARAPFDLWDRHDAAA